MTKTKIHYIIDTLYYFALIFMPAILLVVVGINGGVNGMIDLMGQYTGAFAGTEIYSAIDSIIGVGGSAPLLTHSTIWIIDWIVLVVYGTVFHLVIDCLSFIPALAHNLMTKLGGAWFE